jgi:hypothetical protein
MAGATIIDNIRVAYGSAVAKELLDIDFGTKPGTSEFKIRDIEEGVIEEDMGYGGYFLYTGGVLFHVE